VRFGDQTVSVARGATVLEAARLARVELRHYCGGNCSCGTCRVEIVHGERALSPVASMEAMVLGDAARRRGDRLACQAEILGPVTVHVPEFF
jgi:ferredoxin